MNLRSGIRVTPAGNEMNVLTTGSRRPKNTVAAPYLRKNPSAISISCGRMSRYLPNRSRNGRPPYAPMAYATSDPSVFPRVATTTTIQKLHGPFVSGSSWVGSDTSQPAYGRISSDGSGTIADSIAIAAMTPTYPTAPYRLPRNGMTIWSMKASTFGGAPARGGPGRRPAGYGAEDSRLSCPS